MRAKRRPPAAVVANGRAAAAAQCASALVLAPLQQPRRSGGERGEKPGRHRRGRVRPRPRASRCCCTPTRERRGCLLLYRRRGFVPRCAAKAARMRAVLAAAARDRCSHWFFKMENPGSSLSEYVESKINSARKFTFKCLFHLMR